MFRMRKLPGRFKTKNKLLLSNMKVICRPTAGRRDQSANHFSSEKDALAYIGYKNLRSFALPQKADSISVNATADKKETSATSRFPNYTVVQTDRSM